MSNFRFERSSFWVGFLAGALFMWIVLRLRALLPEFIRWTRKQIQAARDSLTTSTESRLRNDTFNLVQRMHLASSLFSLNEILIEPKVLAPPLDPEKDPETVYIDITQDVIPYMPDWPEMASWYGAQTLSLPEALSGGANLVLIGQPGTGKTTSLAYLASQLTRREPNMAALNDRLPLFVHAIDLYLKTEPKEIHDPLVNAIASHASALTLPRLPELIRSALAQKRALILLDGLDELPNEDLHRITPWLEKLLQQFPGNQVIATAAAANYGGLNQLGFIPLVLAAWNEQQIIEFINQWDELWNRHITSLQPGKSEFIDSLLLTSWLKTRESHPSPFELTMKVWATFAGDLLGSDTPSLIETYLRRLNSSIPNSLIALERLASQMMINSKVSISQEEAQKLIGEFEISLISAPKQEEATESEADQSKPAESAKKSDKTPRPASGSQMVSLFINNGILVVQAGSQVRFFHPLFSSLLAGRALAGDGNITAIVSQPDWSGKFLTLGFVGAYGDLSGLVNTLLANTQNDILYRDLFRMARWLPNAPKQATWRANILRGLASLVQKEYLTMSLAARAICALALSGDPGIGSLFRQLLRSEQPNLRQLGALGSGLICDSKAVQDLEALVEDVVSSVGKASCLALVSIGNKAALDAVVATLLQGSELMRRAAAESLVNNKEEGVPTLEEGAAVDDLLVRRSVVFGYTRLNQPAFITALQKMAVEDGQWVVRNAAAHALEMLNQSNPYVPHALPPVTEIPWLISFAGKQGMGVQPGKPALELIIKAIENGDEKEKLNALEYLRLSGNDYGIHRIYSTYFGSLETIREAAYNTLWHIAASGIPLPPPAQFGLGKL